MVNLNDSGLGSSLAGIQLKKLSVEQVEQIDRLLVSVGDYGEVHVIVQRGEVKYINRVEGHKTWKVEKKEST